MFLKILNSKFIHNLKSLFFRIARSLSISRMYVYLFTLVLLTTFICFKNYTPNTILSGWDTLHSEFNFPLAIERSLSSAYQEHQGLGAVSAQSHIGDLPRILQIYFLSYFLPDSFLRYSYVFIMLIIGPIGVYLFLISFLRKINSRLTENDIYLPAFFGAIFYLCNLSVVQHFIVPLEMFVTLYGYLGFLFLTIERIQNQLIIKNVLLLALVSVLIAPASHTPTLFYMTLMLIGVIQVTNLLFNKNKKDFFVKSMVILSTIIGTNLFWILPNAYFIYHHGYKVSSSKIHTLFSDQAYLSNLSFGQLSDTAILKNYLFIWEIFNGKEFIPLLQDWSNNLGFYQVIFGYLLFILAVIGGSYGAAKKPHLVFGFLAAFLLSLIFISSSKSFAGEIVDFIRENIPLMKEALRFPFNKFSTFFSFTISIFISLFFYELFTLLKGRIRLLKYVILIVYIIPSLSFFYPAFQGKLINDSMKVRIDPSYFEVFDYFNQQEKYGRVADLPIHSIYGWTYYNFNYQGAGFLWFGIKQPLLNREFDRWGFKNEEYFNEMNFAIYNQSNELLYNVLEKYSIRWVLLDENIVAPQEEKGVLFIPEIKKILSNSSRIKLATKFGNISIYEYQPIKDFQKSQVLISPQNLTNEHFREFEDLFYKTYGDYFSYQETDISYGLKSSNEYLNTKIISSDEHNFYLKNLPHHKLKSHKAEINLQEGKILITSGTNKFHLISRTTLPAHIISVNNNLILQNPKSINLNESNSLEEFEYISKVETSDLKEFMTIGNCSANSDGTNYSYQIEDQVIRVVSQKSEVCFIPNIKKLQSVLSFDEVLITTSLENKNSKVSYCFKSGDICRREKLASNFQMTFDPKQEELIFFITPLNDKVSQTVFENFEITLLSKKGFTNFALPTTDVLGEASSITVPKDKDMSGSLEKFGFSPSICGSYDILKSPLGFFESSTNNICDNYQIYYDPFSYHLLEIKSKNYSGLPLRLCLQNEKTKRCDFLISLPKNEELKSDYLILPPFYENHNLAVTNQVVEGNLSKNEISYLSVTKIPYREMFLNLQTANENLGKKVFYLDNSYEDGFVLMCGIWPCNSKQVLVNNWANGWVIENEQMANNLWVFFWPNTLTGIGVILGILSLTINTWFVKKFN